MKILLILSAGPRYRDAVARGSAFRSYAPTTLLQLEALVPAHLNARVRMVDLMVDKLPDQIDADIVGISTITCGAPEAYRIASILRKKGITVVLGGSHPSLMPEEALQFADSVVVGYAENTWPKLLEDFKNNGLKRIYSDELSPFSKPMPPLSRNRLSRSKYFFRGCIEASRGCPNECSFCVLSANPGNSCWTRSIDEVIREIETIGKRVLFLDSSFSEMNEYTVQLWNAMIPLKIKWYAAVTSRFMEDEAVIKLAVKSGCKGVLIGFESLNQESLSNTQKGFSSALKFREGIRRLHDYGVGILGCFVFGFDEDDESVFEKTVRFVDSTKIDIVKYGILTPFPGTPLYKSLKQQGRILTEDWNLYDTEHVVFKPARMTPEKLEQGCKWAFHETYSFSSMFKRVFRKNSQLVYSLPGNLAYRKIAYTYI